MMKTLNNYQSKLAIVCLALAMLNLACGNRVDAIKGLNDSPKISKITLGGKELTPSPSPIEDSLKNSLKTSQRFELLLEASDVNGNLSQLSFVAVGEPKGRFWANDLPLVVGQPWKFAGKSHQVKIAYEPKTGALGSHEFEAILTDKLGASTRQKFALTCFDNMPPIAELEAKFTGPDPRQYQLDMSASKDADHQHGGRVLFYHIKVNNRPTITETIAKIPYIFNEGTGTYLIKYWVTDSDGEESEKKSLSLEIK